MATAIGRTGRVVLALLCLAPAAACRRDERPLLLIGDSLTAGACAEDPCVPFAAIYAEQDPSAVQAGCGASTSSSWIQHGGAPVVSFQCRESLLPRRGADPQRALVFPHVPARAAFVLLGANDVRFGDSDVEPIEPVVFKENLRTLVHELRDLGVERVVLVKPPYNEKHHVLLDARIDAYALVIDELCAEEPASLCGPDLREVLLPEHYADDPVHPNQAGHRAIARAYVEFARRHDL